MAQHAHDSALETAGSREPPHPQTGMSESRLQHRGKENPATHYYGHSARDGNGIKPKHFAALMNSDPHVNVHASLFNVCL